VTSQKNGHKLDSCLINAQPLPAHSPAADDNSLIGGTSHELTDDINLPWKLGLGLGLDLKLHYFSMFHGE